MIFLDVETTGLNCATCSIVELAIVDETGRCLLSTRYAPTGLISKENEEALEYNKLDLDDLLLYPTLGKEELNLIKRLFKNQIVVAHNVEFDSKFLIKTSMEVFGENIFKEVDWVCSMKLYAASKNIKSGRIKLPNLQTDSIPHSALSDTQNCRLLYQSLTKTSNPEWNW